MDSKSSIQGFAAALQSAIAWLGSLGIRVGSTRFGQYLKQAEEIIGTPDLVARSDTPEFNAIMEGLEAGAELHFIHRHLSECRDEGMVRKLSDFAKGPYFQDAELASSSSNKARNAGFELYFGAQLARAGYDVIFDGRADLEIVAPEILFECKRPQSTSKLEYNLRKARKKLVRANANKTAVRVIALSVGKMMNNSSGLLYTGSASQLDEAIDDDLKAFKHEFERYWQQPKYDAIAGVWLHYVRVIALTSPPTFARRAHDRIIDFGARGRREWSAVLNEVGDAIIKDNGLEQF